MAKMESTRNNDENVWNQVENIFHRKEKDEDIEDKIICKTCGNDSFRVYVTIIIDDARLYCTKCGKDPEDY